MCNSTWSMQDSINKDSFIIHKSLLLLDNHTFFISYSYSTFSMLVLYLH